MHAGRRMKTIRSKSPPRPPASLAALARKFEATHQLVVQLAEWIRYRPDLHRKDVLRLTGWSESTLYRRVKAKLFPEPDLATGRPRWKLADVIEQVPTA